MRRKAKLSAHCRETDAASNNSRLLAFHEEEAGRWVPKKNAEDDADMTPKRNLLIANLYCGLHQNHIGLGCVFIMFGLNYTSFMLTLACC